MNLTRLYPKLGDLVRMPANTQTVYKLPAELNTFQLLKQIQAYSVRCNGQVSTRSWLGVELHSSKVCKFVEVIVRKQGEALKVTRLAR